VVCVCVFIRLVKESVAANFKVIAQQKCGESSLNSQEKLQ
jgi:hypothetical protein